MKNFYINFRLKASIELFSMLAEGTDEYQSHDINYTLYYNLCRRAAGQEK